MLLVVSKGSVSQPGRLATKTVPRKFLSIGVTLYPRGGPKTGLWWRVFIEKPLPRYLLALWPFPALILAYPEYALALSQAPLLMFGVVLMIETYVLTVSTKEARNRLIDADSAQRVLDLLQVRGREVLTRIASGRALDRGRLLLVVEQSGLVRVPPLTTVSVQQEGTETGFLELTEAEQAFIHDELFTNELNELDLRRVCIRENDFLRVVVLDVSTISAHARLAAMAATA